MLVLSQLQRLGYLETMLVNEQLFITGVSIAAGILVGILTSRLFIPLIQIALEDRVVLQLDQLRRGILEEGILCSGLLRVIIDELRRILRATACIRRRTISSSWRICPSCSPPGGYPLTRSG